jgi:nitrite reductase/ring-hydroxylating ferredoxin subunit
VNRRDSTPTWWTVAHTEDLYDIPIPVRVDAHELVAFRDTAGDARVLNDVCPHRRVPLSLGRVDESGTLQCGYHGWCFEGSSGKLTRIPNYRPDQRVPPRVGVRAWPTVERHGLVQVWSGDGRPGEPPELQGALACAAATGTVELPASHHESVAALLGDPVELLFGAVVEQADVEELQIAATSVHLTRRLRRLPGILSRVALGPKGAEFLLTSQTWAGSGLTELKVVALDHVTVLQVVAAATPVTADRTQLRWRARCRGDLLVRGRNRGLRALTRVVASAASERVVTLTGAATTAPAFAAWRDLSPEDTHDKSLRLVAAAEAESGGHR